LYAVTPSTSATTAISASEGLNDQEKKTFKAIQKKKSKKLALKIAKEEA
jgi:hypothetical protein